LIVAKIGRSRAGVTLMLIWLSSSSQIILHGFNMCRWRVGRFMTQLAGDPEALTGFVAGKAHKIGIYCGVDVAAQVVRQQGTLDQRNQGCNAEFEFHLDIIPEQK
jgi:hypothetical protein